MPTLEGRTVVIIGAGSRAPGWSNGKACAVSYARAGANVVCVDHVMDRAQETADVIGGEGGRALALQADATRESDVNEVVTRAVAEFGRLDVMHNNVGVGGALGTPDQVPPDVWAREIEVDLTTAYLGIRCAMPIMREQGGGAITNVSSTLAVRFVRQPNVAYSAAKAAVEAMTRACAVAYGRHGIRVNCLRIGFSDTPLIVSLYENAGMSDEQIEDEMAKRRSKVPLRREQTNPFDIGSAAVFLASDDARSITGAILNVDGGLEVAPI